LVHPDQIAVVALGSNVGDPRDNVLRALEQLAELSAAPLIKSSLWRTSPLGCPPNSPPFINAVAILEPVQGETPESLLHKLQHLEQEFGRVPKLVLNEPRPLDLDLIVFKTEQWQSPRLTLPHPRAHLRQFLLQPLCEIAPDLLLPGQSSTARELLDRLDPDPAMRRIS
jgi:2-amino-4-hydroxy-6-hydroxymethyldihydropteridine diphosphokinase